MKAIAIKSSLFSCLKTYNKKTFMSDLMAGIIVGIVALPLAIAFGIASGVTPEKGIITAIWQVLSSPSLAVVKYRLVVLREPSSSSSMASSRSMAWRD